MDRSQLIGIILIFTLAYFFMVYNTPSQEEIEAQKRKQDSIAQLDAPVMDTSTARISPSLPEPSRDTSETTITTPPVEEKFVTLENDLIALKFSSFGARIVEATLKEHFEIDENEAHEKSKSLLKMMNHPDNRWGFEFKGNNGQTISTSNLVFNISTSGRTITFTANQDGINWSQSYTLEENSYLLTSQLNAPGISQTTSAKDLELVWDNYLNRLELNVQYERYYSTVYFKEADENPDYCSCRGDDQEKLDEAPVLWISHANQFFNTSVIPENSFSEARLEVVMLEDDEESLKLLKTRASSELALLEGQGLNMKIYVGPNDFERLSAFGNDLEDIVPFGSSIFGTINRWIIRPMFNFLSTFIGSKGLVIIVLTVIVKLALYPLTYKMLYSQMKMASLKPEMEKIKAKFKDDQSKQQMETMKMYREFGVNPLGGCLPMVLQMPIWFALYRFFPASLEFRQASFLWADDLSSYDVIAYLPFEIPMFGAHISLFTILWVATTLIYTWYNSRLVDMSANPAMKYMQYLMPVMFLFFFNNYASGLTAYLMFSNIFNIGQTVVTKNFIIDEEKIKVQLNANKSKPKKKGKFQQRLEDALKEQQRIQAEKQKGKK